MNKLKFIAEYFSTMYLHLFVVHMYFAECGLELALLPRFVILLEALSTNDALVLQNSKFIFRWVRDRICPIVAYRYH